MFLPMKHKFEELNVFNFLFLCTGLSGLSLLGEPNLCPMYAALNVSRRAYAHLQEIHKKWRNMWLNTKYVLNESHRAKGNFRKVEFCSNFTMLPIKIFKIYFFIMEEWILRQMFSI